jgi:hypothetical protein
LDFSPAIDFEKDDIEIIEEIEKNVEKPKNIVSGPKVLGKEKKNEEEDEDEEEEKDENIGKKKCDNCNTYIDENRLMMHEIHCKKNIIKCKECFASILKSDKKLHNHIYHRKIECECGSLISNDSLREHKLGKIIKLKDLDECSERISFCSTCKNPFNQSQLSLHEISCKSKN